MAASRTAALLWPTHHAMKPAPIDASSRATCSGPPVASVPNRTMVSPISEMRIRITTTDSAKVGGRTCRPLVVLSATRHARSVRTGNHPTDLGQCADRCSFAGSVCEVDGGLHLGAHRAGGEGRAGQLAGGHLFEPPLLWRPELEVDAVDVGRHDKQVGLQLTCQ